MNVEESSQLGKHGFVSLHNPTQVCHHNEYIDFISYEVD